MFLVMPFQNLLVLFAEDVWSVGAQGLGTLSAVAGLGGLVGAVVVAWRSDTTRRLRLMMGAVFGFGVFLVGFALSPWYLLALPLVFVANIFANLYSTLNNTAIQMLIPDQIRGRISSFLMMSFSLPILGTLPVSAVAQSIGAPYAISLASVLAVLIALGFYFFSKPLRSLDERMLEAHSGTATAAVD
jgi:MFS family permease